MNFSNLFVIIIINVIFTILERMQTYSGDYEIES